jgi:hypothetical protein
MKGDPFEIWWDNMFALPPGAKIKDNTNDWGGLHYDQSIVDDDFSGDALNLKWARSSGYTIEPITTELSPIDTLNAQIDADIMAILASSYNQDVTTNLLAGEGITLNIADDLVSISTCDNGGYTINTIVPPSAVTFYDNNSRECLTINFDTGQVVLSDKMSIEDSAGLFWDAVIKMNPLQPTYAQPSVTVELAPAKTDAERALEAYTNAMKVVR